MENNQKEEIKKEDKKTENNACCNKNENRFLKIVVIVLSVLLIAGIGFGIKRFAIAKHNLASKRANMADKVMPGKSENFGNARGMQGARKNEFAKKNRISGKVTKIDGNNLTINNNNKDIIVIIADNTSIRNNNQIAAKNDVKVGDEIMVMGQSDSNGQITAKMINIKNSSS